jgi:predicted secreted protein
MKQQRYIGKGMMAAAVLATVCFFAACSNLFTPRTASVAVSFDKSVFSARAAASSADAYTITLTVTENGFSKKAASTLSSDEFANFTDKGKITMTIDDVPVGKSAVIAASVLYTSSGSTTPVYTGTSAKFNVAAEGNSVDIVLSSTATN